MTYRIGRRRALDFALICGASAIGLAVPAYAQTSAPPQASPAAAEPAGSELADIVVTAQRRAQSAQSVGITISAFSGTQLRNLGIKDSADIAALTPGVSTTGAQGGFLKTFSIRGVTMSDFNPHQEGPIAVYTDDVYISSLQGQSFATFDTERVEVLKGPQGTLFGRNATGGLVNYVSRKPTDTFEGSVSGSYGSYNERQLQAAVGGPIADGVQFRVAGNYGAYSPILHNLVGKDGLWDRNYAGRVHLKLEPTDKLKILLSGRIGRDYSAISGANQLFSVIAEYDAQGRHIDTRYLGANETAQTIVNGVPTGTRPCAGCDYLGSPIDPDGAGHTTNDPMVGKTVALSQNTDTDENYVKSEGGTINLTYDVRDGITLSSISDYSHFKWRLGSSVVDSATPTLGYDTFTHGINQYSEELRLNGTSGRVTWVVGGYYLRITSDNGAAFGDFIGYFGGGSPSAPNPAAAGDTLYLFSQKTRSLSGFGQAEWQFAPQLTLTAGARVISEKKRFDYQLAFYSKAANATFPVEAPFDPSTTPLAIQKNTLWSAKLGLNYKPSQDVLLYATFNRGVKAGGFNVPQGPVPLTSFLFRPEVLLAYEGGFKSELFDRALRVNGALFYYDYQNYQAFQNLGVGDSEILNAKARTYGGEMEVTAQPTQGLNLTAGAAYTNALVKNVTYTFGLTADRRPAFAPKVQLDGIARYQFPITHRFDLALQSNVSYRSAYFMQLTNYSILRQNGFALVNATISLLRHGGGWRIEGAVRNLTDKRYKQSQFDVSEAFGNTNIAYDRGRVFTIGASYDW